VETKIKEEKGADAIRIRRVAGNRSLIEAQSLRNTLRTWFTFYDSYDPMFTWWAEEAYKTADTALESYTKFLREKVAGLPPPKEEAGAGANRPPRSNCNSRKNRQIRNAGVSCRGDDSNIRRPFAQTGGTKRRNGVRNIKGGPSGRVSMLEIPHQRRSIKVGDGGNAKSFHAADV